MYFFGQLVADIERPDRASQAAPDDDILSPEPKFESVSDVRHRFRGKRPNGLEGAIVHYDAGRTAALHGDSPPDFGAKATLRHAQKHGFAYCTISLDGKILLPANMDWKAWGSHAGRSSCPATGRNWVSRFYVGFEINSPGFVYPTEDENVFVPWFNARRNASGHVILDSKGCATRSSPKDVSFKPSDLTHVKSNKGNIRKGYYVPYTKDQMQALTDVLLWLKREYAPTFRLERVFGHDEVAPGRKIDPGGCLRSGEEGALTMPQFRASLLRAYADRIGSEG